MTTKHLYVTSAEYEQLCEDLVLKVADSGWQFDTILCLARGGMRPGDIFSRVYDMPLAVLATSSYVAQAGRQQGQMAISGSVALARGAVHGRVLVVDDLADSGKTLSMVGGWIREHYPDVTEVRTAVIWHKACSCIKPDYCVSYLPDCPWIHQPFECYDALGVAALRARVAARGR